jgi:hypothetical protein
MRSAGTVLVGLALSISGCGDGDPVPATCGVTNACGGDVVGVWVPDGSCVNGATVQARYMTEFGSECPDGASVSIVDMTSDWARVSSTFNADGTYSATTTFSAWVQFLVPAACFVTRGCADVDASLRAMIDPTSGIVTASCRNAGDVCACSVNQQKPTTTEAGTYTTSGTVLTTMPTGGAPTDTPYCVQGAQLHLIRLDTTGAASIASDILMIRK